MPYTGFYEAVLSQIAHMVTEPQDVPMPSAVSTRKSVVEHVMFRSSVLYRRLMAAPLLALMLLQVISGYY